jgi:ATP-dependent RNA helicase DHX57
MTTAADTAV